MKKFNLLVLFKWRDSFMWSHLFTLNANNKKEAEKQARNILVKNCIFDLKEM